jgi:two-component system chemotaxis sensor kinase CheA
VPVIPVPPPLPGAGAPLARAARRTRGPRSGAARATCSPDELLTTAERASPVQRTRHVRIELSRLDTLLNLIGELVIVRGRLQALVRGLPEPALHEAVTDASRAS